MNVREEARKMKLCAPALAASSMERRNAALEKIAEGLQNNKERIFAANREDMKAAEEAGIQTAVLKRLKYDEAKMQDGIAGIRELITLPDPVGRVLLSRELDEGLELRRISCPIGVIGVIFEARPDALVQISSLCIKSGNCAILKGGKETTFTNRVLFEIIRESVLAAGMPEGCLLQVEQHNEIDELLACDRDVDLLIPRGSNAFVRYIMENTKIPVMGHSSGICHVYVDETVDEEQAIPVIVDAKIQYAAACNAAETLLVNRKIAANFLPKAAKALRDAGVSLRGTEEAEKIIDLDGVMGEDDFATEYNDLIMSVKLVEDVQEAVDHINRFGSHHTDCILTTDDERAEYFMQMVDSAGVYRNCSTRFADGYRYGFGAEVGISTGKLHARGPVGLEGLVTYKYRLCGHGQIVADYASGKKTFHHRDL
uniref:Gamma-glutamyl phosphate reductase n=1 Tax=Eubacterium cellulosolvens (strain ATCC 43171 / JCM 9499 / 6) TaxID=633697 RepID=I5ASY3_EUBC6